MLENKYIAMRREKTESGNKRESNPLNISSTGPKK